MFNTTSIFIDEWFDTHSFGPFHFILSPIKGFVMQSGNPEHLLLEVFETLNLLQNWSVFILL